MVMKSISKMNSSTIETEKFFVLGCWTMNKFVYLHQDWNVDDPKTTLDIDEAYTDHNDERLGYVLLEYGEKSGGKEPLRLLSVYPVEMETIVNVKVGKKPLPSLLIKN